MIVMCQMLFEFLTALCLLQGPIGSKGERGERVSEEALDHLLDYLLLSGLPPLFAGLDVDV